MAEEAGPEAGSRQPTEAGRDLGPQTVAGRQGMEDVAETVRGVPADVESSKELIPCPVCDYPASSRVDRCPMCGSLLKGDGATGVVEESGGSGAGGEMGQSEPAGGSDGTVQPFRQPEIQVGPAETPQPMLFLERVGRPEESSKILPFAAVDGEVQVNRQGLDENNFTITSRLQASFVFKDNTWWLLDRSDLKTTFIQVKEAVELKDGDIILMGDRRFIFYYDGIR